MHLALEGRLQALALADRETALLCAQWRLDEEGVGKALTTIASWFPHYSLHDRSHARKILGYVERLLGTEGIARLSATDIWLLLEAAYWHDSGMIVRHADLQELVATPEFLAHLDLLERSTDFDLRNAAVTLRTLPTTAPERSAPEYLRALQLIVSDIYRARHPSRSMDYVLTPSMIGTAAHRTEALPLRLFQHLGHIVRGHGENIDWVLEHLPRDELGVGTDEAHPRFVACLLRLGDLLDLDSGRFCPTSQLVFGPRPARSRAHEKKHASISRFYVGPDRIDVEARCSDMDSYEETYQWLGWLKDELETQAARWGTIAPKDIGPLAQVGQIHAYPPTGYRTTVPGKKPRFEADREAVLEIARGTNLYANRSVFLRELIQNAIDATLIRAWHEHQTEILSSKPGEHQFPDEEILDRAKRILSRYPIEVNSRLLHMNEDGTATWNFIIRDRGTGISIEDLKYLQRIGSSWKNPSRMLLRHTMPEWMWPSGTFGLGLQSAFLVTDEVRVRSHHFKRHERLNLVLRHVNTAGEDGIEAQILAYDDPQALSEVGTEIEVAVRCRNEIGDDDNRLKIDALYDEVTREEFPRDAARFWEFAKRLSDETGLATVTVHSPERHILSKKQLSEVTEFLDRWGRQKREAHIDAGSVMIGVSAPSSPTKRNTTSTGLARVSFDLSNKYIEIYFRGIRVSKLHWILGRQLSASCDLYVGTARDLLQLNRDSFRKDIEPWLRDVIAQAELALVEKLRRTAPSSKLLPELSLHLLTQGRGGAGTEWTGVAVPTQTLDGTSRRRRASRSFLLADKPGGPFVSLGKLAEASTVATEGEDMIFTFDNGDKLAIRSDGTLNAWSNILFPHAHTFNVRGKLNINSDPMKFFDVYSLSLIPLGRLLLPCLPEYEQLAIHPESYAQDSYTYHRIEDYPEQTRWMLSPFCNRRETMTVDRIADYVRWTGRHSAIAPAPVERDIVTATWRYLVMIQRFLAQRSLARTRRRQGLSPADLESARVELELAFGIHLAPAEDPPHE